MKLARACNEYALPITGFQERGSYQVLELIRVLHQQFDFALTRLSAAIMGSLEPNSIWSGVQAWQSLIAGLVGFAGAGTGAIFLWRQTSLQAKQYQRELQQRRVHARLLLSHALDDLHNFLAESLLNWQMGTFRTPSVLSDKTVSDIADCAIGADEPTFEAIRALIRDTQTFKARYSSTRRSPPAGNIGENMVADIAQLLLSTEALFPFARFEVETTKRPTMSRSELNRKIQYTTTIHHYPSGHPIQVRVAQALDMRFPSPNRTEQQAP